MSKDHWEIEEKQPEADYDDCPVEFNQDAWRFLFLGGWRSMEYSMCMNTIGFMYEGEDMPHSNFILYRSVDYGLVPWQSTGAVPERPRFVRIRKG